MEFIAEHPYISWALIGVAVVAIDMLMIVAMKNTLTGSRKFERFSGLLNECEECGLNKSAAMLIVVIFGLFVWPVIVFSWPIRVYKSITVK